MKRMSFSLRTKLIVLFVTLGAMPMLISNVISYISSSKEIERRAIDKTDVLVHGKIKEISRYFREIEVVTLDLAHLPMTQAALIEFEGPFKHAKVDPGSDFVADQKESLRKYYKEQFGAEYKKQNGSDIDVDQVIATLDPLTVIAQNEFIVFNEHPLGQKNKLVQSTKNSPYSLVHQKYHTAYDEYLTSHELYDIFLVNNDGRVVYTVFKELDFATSLTSGPWAKSGLAAAFQAAKGLSRSKVHFVDYSSYTPSYDSPAGFLSAAVFDTNGEQIGALIVQFPINKIAEMYKDKQGIGETGGYLLLGSDGTLRADANRLPDTLNVKNQFKPGSTMKVESEIIGKAVSQKEDGVFYTGVSYDGTKVLAMAEKVKLANVEWITIAELGHDETFAGLKAMQRNLIILMLISSGLVGLVAYMFGNRLGGSLSGISDLLNRSSQEVSNSSSQSAASSTELSEAATEQAASLQETMASIEEISAMVNQNAESASRAKIAVDANQASSEDGARSVDEMMRSISEIKTTNDDILAQMEASNKEFGEIVKIISDIGEKTTVINDIVFQTKLLSFNASVEAARAGEHGKGFAVVAEEVGNLAQMSGNAAREISEMLAQSIKRVNGIVEQTRDRVDQLVEVGKDKITMGQSTAQKCRESLSKITENAKSMSSMISEITHASKEQAQGIQEINKAISQLDQVTQQNSAVAQQSSSQAEELHSQAAELQSAVSSLVVLISGNADRQPTESGKGETSSKAKILNMKKGVPIVKTKSPVAGSAKIASSNHKRASGSDVVPSSNDPGFEEF